MSTKTDSEMATNSVVGKQFVSIDDYKQLLSRAFLMERKLKAFGNIQDLLRQKDVELRKCKNIIHQYQMALHRSECRRTDSMHLITKISDDKDRFEKEPTCEVEAESDQNVGCCLPCTSVNGGSSQRLDEMAVACDVVDGDTVQTTSIVSATSAYKDSIHIKMTNEEDSLLKGNELQDPSGIVATNPQKFQHETGASLTEGLCDQITSPQDEMKTELIPRSVCSHLQSNQERTDQRKRFQSPPVTSMSKDLLTKLMQQNARLKKVLRDILSCRGTSVEQYIGIEELKDTIIQLRQRLTESTNQVAELETKIKTYEDIEQRQSSQSQDDRTTIKEELKCPIVTL